MTTVATILAALPLALASGAGAAGRRLIGPYPREVQT